MRSFPGFIGKVWVWKGMGRLQSCRVWPGDSVWIFVAVFLALESRGSCEKNAPRGRFGETTLPWQVSPFMGGDGSPSRPPLRCASPMGF